MPKTSRPSSFGMKPVDELIKARFNGVMHRGQVAWIGLSLAFDRLVGSREIQARP
jgi:hypothetical protein